MLIVSHSDMLYVENSILYMRVVEAYVCNWQLNFQVEIKKIKSVSE